MAQESVTCGFYPSLNGDRKYSAKEFGSIFDGVIEDGVFMTIGNRFKVTPGEGFSVLVGTGRAWFMHTWTLNVAEVRLTIQPADPLLPRWDAVALDINQSMGHRNNAFKIITGAPASKPSRPVPVSNDTHREVIIAWIKVNAKATTITGADIYNVVGKSSEGGPPFVTGPLKTITLDEIYLQIQHAWDQFFDDAKYTWNSLQYRFEDDIRDFKSRSDSLISEYETNFRNRYNRFDQECSEFIESATRRFTSFEDTWRSEFTALYNSWRDAFDTLYNDNATRFNNFMNEADYRYRSFMMSAENTFNDFMTRVDAAFDAFVDQKNEEIDEMLSHLGDEFASFWADFRNRMNTYLSGQETIWENWFTHIQGQLSEDAATHLQNQIDALTYIYVYDNELVFPFNAASRAGNELILSNPTTITPIPAFAVNPDTGHLEYTNNQTYNVDDTSGHIVWDLNE